MPVYTNVCKKMQDRARGACLDSKERAGLAARMSKMRKRSDAPNLQAGNDDQRFLAIAIGRERLLFNPRRRSL